MEGDTETASEASPPPSPPPEPRNTALEFTGSGGEYFRIWIVNLALTIVTLGIYSAWAKVRRLRYLYGNTQLDGHAFEYHGTPQAILRGRLIAVAAIAIYLVAERLAPLAAGLLYLAFLIGLPWIMLRARQFALRVTSWRGIRFNFDSRYSTAAGVYLLGPLLVMLSLGFALPWFVRRQYRWLIDHSAFGTTRFVTDTRLGPYFGIAFKTLGLLIAVFVLIGAALGGLFAALSVQFGTEPGPASMLRLVGIAYLLIVPALFVLRAYWRSRVLNYTLGQTTLGPHRLGCAFGARRLAFIYVTNLLGIVFTLGLYTPWAVIRAYRYQVESASVRIAGSSDEFIAAQTAPPGAAAQELGELLDVDLGL
jgi:uncharacterized membrane protein YjgN (DUF898 family)